MLYCIKTCLPDESGFFPTNRFIRQKYLRDSNFAVVTAHSCNTKSRHSHHEISVKTHKVSAHVPRDAACNSCVFAVR